MKSFKKVLIFSLIIVINLLLLIIIILNNSVYTFNQETKLYMLNQTCKSVYYEPYNIFSYRTLGADMGNEWLFKNGDVGEMVIPPGSYVSIYANEEVPSGVMNYEIEVGDNTHIGITEEDYNYLKEKGISENYEKQTLIDYFIVNQGSFEEGYSEKIYQKEDVLGRIKACKE